jgi:hypothetical protein
VIEIISNFHDDFIEIILKRVEYLKKLGFKFLEYDVWKKKETKQLLKNIEQKESRGEDASLEKSMFEENLSYSKYCKDIVYHYYQLSYKIPIKIPRNIYKCTSFFCPPKLEDGLKILEKKIIKGDDLLPHLSRQIFDPTYRDHMLYDFGIVHFHLGTKSLKDNPLLLKRTDELVYALINNDSCYFIKIDHHKKWDCVSLLSTLKKDFPHILDIWKIDCVPINKINNNERGILIKNGINTYLEIDGEYYMSPGMGVNTAGTSSLAVMNMNRNFHYYMKLQNSISQLIQKSIDEVEKASEKKLLDMHLILQEIEPIIIYEPNNNIRFSIIDNRKELSMEIMGSYKEEETPEFKIEVQQT